MDLRKLKTLIDLVSDSNVSELEITEAEGKVRIVKGGGAVVQGYAPAPVYAAPLAAAAPASAPGSTRSPRSRSRDHGSRCSSARSTSSDLVSGRHTTWLPRKPARMTSSHPHGPTHPWPTVPVSRS